MFLKLNMSLIPSNPADVVESPIWSTYFHLVMNCQMTWMIPINENEEDDDDNDDGYEDDDLSQVAVESEEADDTFCFYAFQFLCAIT